MMGMEYDKGNKYEVLVGQIVRYYHLNESPYL